jgi:ribokinase
MCALSPEGAISLHGNSSMNPTRSAPEQAGWIVAVGSLNADFQVRTERRPEISETLLASDFKRFSGGKSANVTYLAKKLGWPARLYAHVGDDDLAEQALGALRKIGVDLSGVQAVPGQSTGVAMITVPPDGKKAS